MSLALFRLLLSTMIRLLSSRVMALVRLDFFTILFAWCLVCYLWKYLKVRVSFVSWYDEISLACKKQLGFHRGISIMHVLQLFVRMNQTLCLCQPEHFFVGGGSVSMSFLRLGHHIGNSRKCLSKDATAHDQVGI